MGRVGAVVGIVLLLAVCAASVAPRRNARAEALAQIAHAPEAASKPDFVSAELAGSDGPPADADASDGGPATLLLRVAPLSTAGATSAHGWSWPSAAHDAHGPAVALSPAARSATWQERNRLGHARLDALEATMARLRGAGHRVVGERFPIAGVWAVTAEAQVLASLAEHPSVLAAWPNRTHRLPDEPSTPVVPVDLRPTGDRLHFEALDALSPAAEAWSRLERVDAPSAWSAGGSGEGSVVAIVDSGVDGSHPALRHSYRGRDGRHDYDWLDSTLPEGSGGRTPLDPLGHGTHVASLAVGRVGERAWGVAPGAEWIAVRAFDAQGIARDVDLLRAGEWLLAPRDQSGANPRPDLAPDVINASWTFENGVDPLFAPLLEAWRAAGIVAVFAAGNDEDGTGSFATIRSPGTSAEALSVGAVDDAGRIWPLSRGGPSADGRIEPDLVAPGVAAVGAEPGGAYGRRSGTSMAAPHVAGAVAVVRAALPKGLADEVVGIERLLQATAVDGGAPGPDAVYGGGLLQVGAAAARARSLARLAGTVWGPDGPLPGALVRAEAMDGAVDDSIRWQAHADGAGSYRLALPAGSWRVSAIARGAAGEARSVTLHPGQGLALDVLVAPVESGEVNGRILGALDAGPVAAAVRLLGPTALTGPETVPSPVLARADAAGRFRLRLPLGEHVLAFAAPSRRIVTRTVSVSPATTATLDVALPRAPSILIVDADAWQAERIWPYLSRPLAASGLAHDVWTIDDPQDRVPEPEELARWDVVLWAHQFGSPGRLDRRRGDQAVTAMLRDYVGDGGRLLLSGQDVATWDSPEGLPNARLAPDFFAEVLGARLVAGGAGGRSARTASGLGPPQLPLDLDWALGRRKGPRLAPDVIAPATGLEEEDLRFATLAAYEDDTTAALGVAGSGGRRALLSFGPESAGDDRALRRLLDGIVGWLEPPALDLSAPDPSSAIRGGTVALNARLLPGRAATRGHIDLSWSEGLRLVGGSRFDPTPDGATWQGATPAQQPLDLPFELRVSPQAHGGDHVLTATLRSQGYRAVVTTTVRVIASDLRPSSLIFDPVRLERPGRATLLMRLRNAGQRATSAVSATLSLPPSWSSAPEDAAASSGQLGWTPDGRLAWRGDVAAGTVVTITLDGQVGAAPSGTLLQATAVFTEASGEARTRLAQLRIAGPSLRWVAPLGHEPTVVAGAPFSLEANIANDGPETADTTLRLSLPAGIELDPESDLPSPSRPGVLERRLQLDPGGGATVRFDLWATPDALGGERRLSLVADDGRTPSAPIAAESSIRVLRADLGPARAWIWPPRARSGDSVTVTLMLANAGDVRVRAGVDDALPPAMTLLPESLAASHGAATEVPGGVRWDPWLPAAGSGYALVDARSAAAVPALGTVPAPDLVAAPSGRLRGPVDLPFGFPFGDTVYTRAWVSDDGLLAFAPPAITLPPLDPSAAGAPAIAVAWRPGRSGPAPRAIVAADGLTVTWPAAVGESANIALHLAPDGHLEWRFGPTAQISDAIAGLYTSEGELLELPPALRMAGLGVRGAPRLDWARLSFRARIGNTVGPNERLENQALLRGPSSETILTAGVLVNRLSLDASGLEADPERPDPGDVVTMRLRLRAEGDVPARDVDARIRLPNGATLLTESLSAELSIAEDGLDLRWRGRLEPGESRVMAWALRVRPTVAQGARLPVRSSITAGGVAPLRREVVLVAGGVVTPAWSKEVLRAAPMPSEEVPFVLRAYNRSILPTRMAISDVLPAGLVYVEGSARSSIGSPPVWEGPLQRLTWTGVVPPEQWLEMRFVTRPSAAPGSRLVNRAWLSQSGGPSRPAEASLLVARDRVFLPHVSLGRNEPPALNVSSSGLNIQAYDGPRTNTANAPFQTAPRLSLEATR